MAETIGGAEGTRVTLQILRGKKQVPVSVGLHRRPLHSKSVAGGEEGAVDARIADLVADMSHQDVAEMVAELGK